MSEQNTMSVTKDFLDSLYKNVKMGADSIIDLMPKVKDDGLRAEMTAELEKYESFAHHNNAMLRRFLDSFNFEYEFRSSTEMYKGGVFNETLKKLLLHYEEIMNIMLP
jgi:hypothetical protein